jgi:hypothetical protein
MEATILSCIRGVVAIAHHQIDDVIGIDSMPSDQRAIAKSHIAGAESWLSAMEQMQAPDLAEIPEKVRFDRGNISAIRSIYEAQLWLEARRVDLESQHCAGQFLEIFFRVPTLRLLTVFSDFEVGYTGEGANFEASCLYFKTQLSALPPFPLRIGGQLFNPQEDLQDLSIASVEQWIDDALQDEALTAELWAIHPDHYPKITISRDEIAPFLPTATKLTLVWQLIESKRIPRLCAL